MMAVKLKTSELQKLWPWLQQCFPGSFLAREVLKSHLKGKFPHLDFFVDQWPNPLAVVIVTDGSEERMRFYDDSTVALFAVNSEALAFVLKTAYGRCTDWSKLKLCCDVASSMFSILRPFVAIDVDLSKKTDLLLKATSSDLSPVSVPDDMKISPVTDATVGIVDATWTFATEHSESYIRHIMRHFPSVCMTTASGEHVGHVLGTACGTLGMLYVKPLYRRQGYAKILITQLAQKYFSQGEDAYVVIEPDNLPSLNLHLSLGFKPLAGFKGFASVNISIPNL